MIEAIRRIGKIKRDSFDKNNFKETFLQELSNPMNVDYEEKRKNKGSKLNIVFLKYHFLNLFS